MSESLDSSEISVAWVTAEANSLLSVTESVRQTLKKLDQKVSGQRVHKARVSIRHLFAVWSVLREDGWETGRFRRQVMKPLKELLKLLGRTRDMDINLELGKTIEVSSELYDQWKNNRTNLQKQVRETLDRLNVRTIRKCLKSFVRKRTQKMAKKVVQSRAATHGSEHHLNACLDKQEQAVQSLVATLATADDYHKLRLALKQWRYLLEDIFGETQKDLEVAQVTLGELHDCDRIKELLIGTPEVTALVNLNEIRRQLLDAVPTSTRALPFGYRPSIKLPATLQNKI
ncbi:MAG: CHAD domain-containing protein [Candidatus Obscuribacterales bacterium]